MALKQLLRNSVEQRLNATTPAQLSNPLSISSNTLSNGTLFELLDS